MGDVIRVVSEIDGVPCVSTTELGRRIGFPIAATFLAKEICKPFAILPNGTYFAVSDFEKIKQELSAFILKAK